MLAGFSRVCAPLRSVLDWFLRAIGGAKMGFGCVLAGSRGGFGVIWRPGVWFWSAVRGVSVRFRGGLGGRLGQCWVFVGWFRLAVRCFWSGCYAGLDGVWAVRGVLPVGNGGRKCILGEMPVSRPLFGQKWLRNRAGRSRNSRWRSAAAGVAHRNGFSRETIAPQPALKAHGPLAGFVIRTSVPFPSGPSQETTS